MEGTTDEFTKLKHIQLEIARNTNVLLYYRERASHSLGKKLRAEVARVFISTEFKDCMRALTRINNDNPEATPIDLAIIEFEPSALKLIDYLNKRPILPETSNCPLIPVIVLLTDESKINDANEALPGIGGANKIINLNSSTKNIMAMIMDIVYNRKRVEETFRSIKKVRVLSSKYPYLPVFGQSSPVKSKEKKEFGIEYGKSVSTSLSGVEFKLEEIEDTSECSSLLPDYLTSARRTTLPFLKHRDHSNLPEVVEVAEKHDELVDPHDTLMLGESLQSELVADDGSFGDKIDFPVHHSLQSHSSHAHADSRGTFEEDGKTNNSDKSKSTTSSFRQAPLKSQAIKLLKPQCRAWWSGSLSTDPIGKTVGVSNIKYEIHPFVEREHPTLARPSTVSGLDKLSVSRYWHQLNSIGTAKKSEDAKSHLPNLHESSHHSDPKHSTPSTPRSIIPLSTTSATPRRPSTSGTHSVAHSEEGSREFSTFVRITKQIAQIAKSTCVDFQVNQLMDVDFAHRRINQGEKDMLIRAANLEKDGDVESAIVCYKRAGVHSKDKQLSKMLLGNLSFRQNKFLVALGYYDMALKILQSKVVRLPQDEYLSHYNRGIIHFRLGNDDEGIKDVEKAVALEPSSIEAREVLAIARRRSGKYMLAIEEASALKVQRLEKDRMERLQAQQNMTNEESFVSSREGSPKREGHSMRPNAKKNGVSFEQSQLSSKLDGNNSMATYGANSYAQSQPPPQQRVFNPAYGGVQIRIDEPSARTGFREKIVDTKKANKSEDAVHGEGGGALKMFKMNNGHELELFDDLFKKPSELQYALITSPAERSMEQLNIIKGALRMFPFLRNMSASSIQELAGAVEYRALTGKEELFVQNEESSTTCLLLSGRVQVRMDASFASTMMDVVLGDLREYQAFAYIDLLFRSPRTKLLQSLEESLFPHFSKQAKLSMAEVEVEATDDKSGGSSVHDEEGELTIKFSKEFQEFWESEPPNRSTAPGMFMTYTMQSPCEFLMVPELEYNRIMADHALAELQSRIAALISCGIFRDWGVDDLIRLARMGQVKFYNGGETILTQGSKPPSLGIVLKGLCKVIKRPNRTEMLYQKLHVALEKADQHDLKYVYHHKVSKGALVPKNGEEAQRSKQKSKHKSAQHKSKHAVRQDPIMVLKKFSTAVYTEPKPATDAENTRKELQAEIEKLQQLIQKAKLQDAIDYREDRTLNSHSHTHKSMDSYDLVRSDIPSKVHELAEFLSTSIANIGILQWPMIFGEACILDPENGISRGTIVADTQCEVLMLHKVQIQTFLVDADFLDRVRGKAMAYPPDPEMVVNLYKDIEWRHFKKEVMAEIATNRWPKKFDTHEPFTI